MKGTRKSVFGAALCAVALMGLGCACAEEPSWAAQVNGEALPLYETQVTHQRTWSQTPLLTSLSPVGVMEWQEGETLQVQLTFPETVESALIRPLSLGLEPQVEGNRVSFPVEGPGSYTVEINGSYMGAAHLFAVPRTEAPEGAIVLEAGEHEQDIVLTSGQTLYLSAGCVLKGKIYAENAKDIAVLGPGMIDGSGFDRWKQTTVPIDFESCSNFRIENITILDPAAWTVNLYHCTEGNIRNVHIVGSRSNSDGFTLQSCEDVTVSGCFVRSWDDSLVVKGYDGDSRRIRFENCVIWTDLAQSCEIGYETRADVMEDITFENITVLHNFHKPVLSIHNSDRAQIRNVTFRNIVVEDAQMGEGDGANLLIELTTTRSQWSKDKERGSIRNVLIENVNVLSGKENAIRIFSFKDHANIDDVTIRNLTILGRPIESLEDVKFNGNKYNGGNIRLEP